MTISGHDAHSIPLLSEIAIWLPESHIPALGCANQCIHSLLFTHRQRDVWYDWSQERVVQGGIRDFMTGLGIGESRFALCLP